MEQGVTLFKDELTYYRHAVVDLQDWLSLIKEMQQEPATNMNDNDLLLAFVSLFSSMTLAPKIEGGLLLTKVAVLDHDNDFELDLLANCFTRFSLKLAQAYCKNTNVRSVIASTLDGHVSIDCVLQTDGDVDYLTNTVFQEAKNQMMKVKSTMRWIEEGKELELLIPRDLLEATQYNLYEAAIAMQKKKV